MINTNIALIKLLLKNPTYFRQDLIDAYNKKTFLTDVDQQIKLKLENVIRIAH